MAHYIRDGVNPRGAEYGATARAADSAAATQQTVDDMLALEMASDESERRLIAGHIRLRRQAEANRAQSHRWLGYAIFALIVAFFVIVYQLGDDSSAVSAAYRAFMATPSSQVPDTSLAPVRAAQAPDAQGRVNTCESQSDCDDL